MGKLYKEKYNNQKDNESRHQAAVYFIKYVQQHDEDGITGDEEYLDSLLFLSRYHYEEGNYEKSEEECRKLLEIGNHRHCDEAKGLLGEIRAASNISGNSGRIQGGGAARSGSGGSGVFVDNF